MTNQKCIAFFMEDFAGGGVEKMRVALAGAFAVKGYRTFLVVARAQGALADTVPQDVTIVDLASAGMASSVRRLRHFVRREQPDFLISSLDHNNIAAMLACVGMRDRTRVVICQHNALSSERALGWKYRLVPALYNLLRGQADAIVAVSAGVADDLAQTARLARRRITVVPNPVIDPAHLPPDTDPAPHPWFCERDRPVFVFAGRLVPQKDPGLLIEAFAHRLCFGPARLIVLGDGPLREAMAQDARRFGIGHHVCFRGYVANPLPWIAQADALLLTSRYEGFGNVIAEALACGTPVIATDCPHGPSEILAGGQFGQLVRVGDANAFARAMTGDLRVRFPAAGLRARGRHYTAENSARAHEALFERLTAGRSRTLFGIGLSRLSAAGIVERVAGGTPGKLRLVVTPNVDHVRLLQQPEFRAACCSADIAAPDGWPVAIYARWRGVARAGRVTGCDVLHQLLAHPAMPALRIAVVAESPATAAALQLWLGTRGLTQTWRVLVAPPGLLANSVAQSVLAAAIQDAQPSILIMTLGAPVSEIFVHRHASALPPVWALCVGQAMKVELGLVKRAPPSWRGLGLEWAWRLAQEPGRLGLRYLKDAAWFPWAVAKDLAGNS